jgi:peptidoglycan-associated lipoprotein
MNSRHLRAAVPVALLIMGFYGCAKRPLIAQLSAPPPNGSAGAGVATGGLGGEGGVEPTANEGAGRNRASVTTHGSSTRAGSPTAMAVVRASRKTTGTSASAGRRAGETAGAGAPGASSSSGAGGVSTESAANARPAAGTEVAMARGAGTTAAEGPGGTTVQGSGGEGAAGQAGAVSGSAARPAPESYAEVPDLHDIHFDFDQYVIRPSDTKVLDTNASWLRANPRTLLLIEGHCDERGTNEYNLALGQHRTTSTLNYLMAQGIAASRITTISYGEERPLCTEHTEECWARNRRAHFLVKAQ